MTGEQNDTVPQDDVVEYQPPRLPGDWTVDDDHATIGMGVEAAGTQGSLASIWLHDGDPERADVITKSGVKNVAWDRLEVRG